MEPTSTTLLETMIQQLSRSTNVDDSLDHPSSLATPKENGCHCDATTTCTKTTVCTLPDQNTNTTTTTAFASNEYVLVRNHKDNSYGI